MFDLLLKNFNLGCYLVMVAARRASLSSDNYYLQLLCAHMLTSHRAALNHITIHANKYPNSLSKY